MAYLFLKTLLIHVGRRRLDAGLNPLMQKEFAHPMPCGRILQR